MLNVIFHNIVCFFSKTLTFNNIPWPPNDPNKRPFKYMQIGLNSPGIIDEPFTERVNFWLNLNLENYDES